MCKLYCLHFCQTYKFIQGCQSLNPKKRKQRDAVWAAFSNGCSAKRSKTCTLACPADSKFHAVLSTEHVSWWQHKLTSLYHFEIEGARPGLKISAPQTALHCSFLSFETQPLQRLIRQESWTKKARLIFPGLHEGKSFTCTLIKNWRSQWAAQPAFQPFHYIFPK